MQEELVQAQEAEMGAQQQLCKENKNQALGNWMRWFEYHAANNDHQGGKTPTFHSARRDKHCPVGTEMWSSLPKCGVTWPLVLFRECRHDASELGHVNHLNLAEFAGSIIVPYGYNAPVHARRMVAECSSITVVATGPDA